MNKLFILAFLIITLISCEDPGPVDVDDDPDQPNPVFLIGDIREDLRIVSPDTILRPTTRTGIRDGVRYVENYPNSFCFSFAEDECGLRYVLVCSRTGYWFFYIDLNYNVSACTSTLMQRGDILDSQAAWDDMDKLNKLSNIESMEEAAYIGLKMEGEESKYGWLKFQKIDDTTLHLIEYAFQN